MRVLITGGAGFIGSRLTNSFIARGDKALVVDDLSRGRVSHVNSSAAFHQVSVMDEKSLAAITADFRPEVICHLAAQIDVRRSVVNPGWDAAVNVVGTTGVLEAARANNARVIFASSGGAIYGESASIPTPEFARPSPMSPYGIAKLCAEQYIELYNRLHSTSHAVLRLANVYGPGQDPAGEAGVVAVLCSSLLAGENPTIYGDGTQTRDYIYVADVVRAFLAVADSGRSGTWNIGTGVETSVLELVRVIGEAAGHAMTPTFATVRPGELTRSAVLAEQAASDLGWQPRTILRDGVTSVLEWMQASIPGCNFLSA